WSAPICPRRNPFRTRIKSSRKNGPVREEIGPEGRSFLRRSRMGRGLERRNDMTRHHLFASAAVAALFAFTAPAHAQLLGGAATGALGGAMGGALGGGFGPAGGSLNGGGWGTTSGAAQGGGALEGRASRLAAKGHNVAADAAGSASAGAAGAVERADSAPPSMDNHRMPAV